MGCLFSCCQNNVEKNQFLFFEEERVCDMLKKQRRIVNKPVYSIKIDKIEVFNEFIYSQLEDQSILKSVRVKNKQTNGEPANPVWKFLNDTILHHRFIELELLSKKNSVNSIFIKLDWYIEEFTCTDRPTEDNDDIIGIYTYMGKKYESYDIGSMDYQDFFKYLLHETDTPYKLLNNNCKHVALRVYNKLTDNDSNNFFNSDQTKNGKQKTEEQLKNLFKQLGIDITKIKAQSIQVIEKRFKKQDNFADLLEKGNAEENLRVSNRMDSYFDIQSLNIVENMDKKDKKKLRKLTLDDESVKSQDLSELFNLNYIENVRILRLNLDNGNKIDLEMESSKINMIQGKDEEDLRFSRLSYQFNDSDDNLVPIMQAEVNQSLDKVLKQLVDKNNTVVNNVKVNDIFNRVSQRLSKDPNNMDNQDKNFQEIFTKKQNKMKNRIEQRQLVNNVASHVVQDYNIQDNRIYAEVDIDKKNMEQSYDTTNTKINNVTNYKNNNNEKAKNNLKILN